MAPGHGVAREILFALAAGVLFAVALGAYLLSTDQTPAEPAAVPAAANDAGPMPKAARPAPELVQAQSVILPFANALAAKRYEAAYALMAPAYRASRSLEQFQHSCEGSPQLSTLQYAGVFSTRRNVLGAGSPGPYREQARATFLTASGAVEADVTLVVDGHEARILALALAGVPVLDAASAR